MLKIATIIVSIIIIAFILLNIFTIIKGDITQKDSEEIKEKPEQEIIAIEAEEFKIETIEEGEGEESKDGDILVVHYTGRLLDGTVFDSSLERNEPFEFTLGEGMVIEGWEEGMKGMKEGEKRLITIPSSMGYGEFGSPPQIPGGAGLEFEVELLEINN